MTNPQWMSTLSLALEIPFDSSEASIWTKVFEKYSKFSDIFITTLITIDIIRLPFINYSFIKFYYHLETENRTKYEKVFLLLLNEFNIHIKQRINSEFLDLEKTDKKQFKENLNKLQEKITELRHKYQKEEKLVNISSSLNEINQIIKELEEKGLNDETENES